jgi:hypothetical protein
MGVANPLVKNPDALASMSIEAYKVDRKILLRIGKVAPALTPQFSPDPDLTRFAGPIQLKRGF